MPKDISLILPSGHKYYDETVIAPTGIEFSKIKIKFPKTSSIKSYTEIKPIGSKQTAAKGELKMLNGDVYKLEKFVEQELNPKLTHYRAKVGKMIFVPTQATKISKDGSITVMPSEEIRPWLESFHPDFNFHLRTKQQH